MSDLRPCAPRPAPVRLRYAPGVDPTMTPAQHSLAAFADAMAHDAARAHQRYVAAAIERARTATSPLDLLAPLG